jgi:hypothetical protein
MSQFKALNKKFNIDNNNNDKIIIIIGRCMPTIVDQRLSSRKPVSTTITVQFSRKKVTQSFLVKHRNSNDDCED